MFDADLAEVYDAIYRARGKDYAAEAAELAGLIRARRPGASSVLDVACGTGEHLRHLDALFDHVEGLELGEGMLAVARAKSPHITVHAGDMCAFDLGTKFDAVTCMFSAVAYLPSAAAMTAAVDAMARNLEPGGVIIIDPWWSPDRFLDGHVSGHVVKDGDATIARVSRSTRADRDHARMEIQVVVATPDGIRNFAETHSISLFTQDDFLQAFEKAGCVPEFIEGGFSGCGLYVAVRS
jgi:SAM-dependent methyltransferase